eukprot:TRINITY_DN4867_c0_g1_i1.p1 TRINITY_DN4867_c0_g1~~TRINITY_DN4867_c0_g1_i1.p1  ORF type:complete len:415 (+),score=138.37 TRINITY_DN4867_c0_g1_i1:1342-2586(+)
MNFGSEFSSTANLSSVSSKFLELSALFEGSQRGDGEIVLDILRNNRDSANLINAANHIDFETPLHVSSEWGRLEVVKILLGYGARIEPKNALGRTPLHLASEQGHLAVVKHLLASGANVHAKDTEGNTPLHCSVIHPNVTLLLLENGARVNEMNENKSTPLHLAALRGSTDTMTKLMNHKALIESVDRNGNTCLHVAVMSKQPDAVVLLLHAGADLSAIDFERNTAMEKARKIFGRALLDHFQKASMEKITGGLDSSYDDESDVSEHDGVRPRIHKGSSSNSLRSFGDDLEQKTSEDLPNSFYVRRMSISGPSPIQLKSPSSSSPFPPLSPRSPRASVVMSSGEKNSPSPTMKSSPSFDLVKKFKFNGFRKLFKKGPDSLMTEGSPESSSGDSSPSLPKSPFMKKHLISSQSEG